MLSHLFGWGKVNLTTLRAAVFSLKKKKKKRKKCARFFHGDESRERERERQTHEDRERLTKRAAIVEILVSLPVVLKANIYIR
jgi:hypothetical protein